MVHPFLDSPLHPHFHQPIDVVGRGLVVRRTSHQGVEFLLRIGEGRIDPFYGHPLQKLLVIDDILLKSVTDLVNIIHTHVGVVGIDLAPTLIDRHEDRFYATRGLRHQRCGARGSNGQARDVASAEAHHVVVEGPVGFLDALDEGVARLALGVVDGKSASLLRHRHRRTVGVQCQCALHLDGKVGGLLRAIAQSQGGQHVALGSDAHARASSHGRLFLDLLPEATLGILHVLCLWVAVDLGDDAVDLLQFQIYDIIHDALGHLSMSAEGVEVKVRLGSEGVEDVGVEVECEQAATVVGTEWYLAAGVGAGRPESQVRIAVGDALPDDRVPKQYTGLRALPGVVDDFLP